MNSATQILGIVGFVLIFIPLLPSTRKLARQAPRDWIEVPATVVEYRVPRVDTPRSQGEVRTPVVEYRSPRDGEMTTGQCKVKADPAKFPVGTQVEVMINPANQSDAPIFVSTYQRMQEGEQKMRTLLRIEMVIGALCLVAAAVVAAVS